MNGKACLEMYVPGFQGFPHSSPLPQRTLRGSIIWYFCNPHCLLIEIVQGSENLVLGSQKFGGWVIL